MRPGETALRRAYELGRLRAGVARAWPLVALTVFALWARERPVTTLAVAGAAFALVVAYVWRGGALARAASVGMLAAIAPLVLPVIARGLGPSCDSCDVHAATTFPLCLAACLGGGLIAGLFVGWRAARLSDGKPGFLLAAGLLAALCGSLGCGVIGLAGVAGMIGGMVGGTVPALLLADTNS